MTYSYTQDGVRYDYTSHPGKDKIILCNWEDDKLVDAALMTNTKGRFRRALARTQDPCKYCRIVGVDDVSIANFAMLLFILLGK
jgi:hypothetical protein